MLHVHEELVFLLRDLDKLRAAAALNSDVTLIRRLTHKAVPESSVLISLLLSYLLLDLFSALFYLALEGQA